MNKNCFLNFILIILLIFQIINLIIYSFTYPKIYSYKNLMTKLYSKIDVSFLIRINIPFNDYIQKFENIFGKYCKSYICIDFNYLDIFFVSCWNLIFGIYLIVAIIISISRKIDGVIILFVASLFNIFNIYISFKKETKLFLPDNKIYIFDKDFNNIIQSNIILVNERIKNMRYISIFIFIIIIIEIIIIFLKELPIQKNNYTLKDNLLPSQGNIPKQNEQNLNNNNITSQIEIGISNNNHNTQYSIY